MKTQVTSKSSFSYRNMAEKLIELVDALENDEIEVDGIDLDELREKAEQYIDSLNRKNNNKKKTELTTEQKQQLANALNLLPDNAESALTAEEIAKELGWAMGALQINSLFKRSNVIVATKVKRQKGTTAKGKPQMREYTGYYIDTDETEAEAVE